MEFIEFVKQRMQQAPLCPDNMRETAKSRWQSFECLPQGKMEQSLVARVWEKQETWMPQLATEHPEFGFDHLSMVQDQPYISILNSTLSGKHRFCIHALTLDVIGKGVDIELGQLKHTFDERYSPYETCLVVEVHFKTIHQYIERFNHVTGENVKPSSIHMTVGARYRGA